MILSDTRIAINGKAGMIQPFNEDHISAASYDLTLADHILVESVDDNSDGWIEVNIDKPYIVKPKQFILASTEEIVTIPPNLCAQVVLRSSAARAGWNHALAGWIDPGFSGQITLELTNQRQLADLEVHTGQRLLQLVVHQLVTPPQALYGVKGNYQHQRRVTRSNLNLKAVS